MVTNSHILASSRATVGLAADRLSTEPDIILDTTYKLSRFT